MLRDVAGDEGATGDGTRQRRGSWVASGLACMLAVAECGIPLESVEERAEDRGQRVEYACFCRRGMRGRRRKKRRGRDMGGRDVCCMLHQKEGGYNRKGGKEGSVGLKFRQCCSQPAVGINKGG